MVSVREDDGWKGELPAYRSHKVVRAAVILDAWPAMERDVGMHRDGKWCVRLSGVECPVVVDPAVFNRHTPRAGEDYLVVYEDGYVSVSPGRAFVEGYRRVASEPGLLHERLAREADPSLVANGGAIEPLGVAGAGSKGGE